MPRWVDEITARIGRVTRLPCFLQLLNPDTVGVGDDVDPVPPVALDAVEGIVGHLAQVFRTQWVFGRPDCRSNAHRDSKATAGCLERSVADRDPKAFGTFS